jgi:hypothetical protein
MLETVGDMITFGALAFPAPESLTQRLDEFVGRAAHAFGVDRPALVGPSRCHPIIDYRQCAMAAAKELGWTHVAIGAAFDRDHSTVVNAVQRVGASDEMTWTAMALVLAERATGDSVGRTPEMTERPLAKGAQGP